MAVRGFALINFHGKGVRRKVGLLGRMARLKDWPRGGRVRRAGRIRSLFGVTRFDAVVQVRAADRRQLLQIFELIEANFSHVEGFEG